MQEETKVFEPTINIEYIELDHDTLCIEGFSADTTDRVTAKVNGKLVDVEEIDRSELEIIRHYKNLNYSKGFSLHKKLTQIKKIEFFVVSSEGELKKIRVVTHKFSHLDNVNGAYRRLRKFILYRRKNNQLVITARSGLKTTLRELAYWPRLLTQLKAQVWFQELDLFKELGFKGYVQRRGLVHGLGMLALPLKSIPVNVIILLFRIAYFICKPLVRKDIWLVSDRAHMAGDNGEAFLIYLLKQNNPKIRPYFVLRKDSSDYERMKKIAPRIVSPASLKYRLLMLLCDKVVSSQANDIFINAFRARGINITDLYTFDFVFLQHGVIKDDLSQWLNRYNRNIQMFVTTAKPEYDAILADQYFYDDKIVRLTGQPRYDRLTDRAAGKLVIMPTWREDLVLPQNNVTGERPHNPAFKETDYYQFYSKLMSSKRLSKLLKENNMTGELYLHPAISVQTRDFASTDSFTVKTPPYNYTNAFSEANILITDFSSVAFDFAYLKKPILYTQFDHDSFYEGHIYDKGYFEYTRDGFGPVSVTVDEAVKELEIIIKNSCKLAPKYKKRIEDFFGVIDTNNSKRVYEDILTLNDRLGNR